MKEYPFNTADDIALALAEYKPLYAGETDGTMYCFFCSAIEPKGDTDHDGDCLWLAAKRLATINADARRFRWLLQGNGYFLEENQLCGPACTDAADADEARREIDAAIVETR